MTLVVGRICQGFIRIDSDSKITDPTIVSNRNNIFTGVLKSIVLTPNISVSYAGDVEIAQKAIEKLYTINDFHIDVVKKELLKIHIDSEYETDFLIASIETQPLLYKIHKGEARASNQTEWIGDIEGYNFFQKNFLPNLKSLDPKHVMETHEKAFEELINSNSVPTVGGFLITIHSRPGGLAYKFKTTVIPSQSSMIIRAMPGQSVVVPIPFGSAQTGSYGYSYLISDEPYNAAVAIHFPFGKFGKLYYPRKSQKIISYENVDGNQFCQRIKEDYNLSLAGTILE